MIPIPRPGRNSTRYFISKEEPGHHCQTGCEEVQTASLGNGNYSEKPCQIFSLAVPAGLDLTATELGTLRETKQI